MGAPNFLWKRSRLFRTEGYRSHYIYYTFTSACPCHGASKWYLYDFFVVNHLGIHFCFSFRAYTTHFDWPYERLTLSSRLGLLNFRYFFVVNHLGIHFCFIYYYFLSVYFKLHKSSKIAFLWDTNRVLDFTIRIIIFRLSQSMTFSFRPYMSDTNWSFKRLTLCQRNRTFFFLIEDQPSFFYFVFCVCVYVCVCVCVWI